MRYGSGAVGRRGVGGMQSLKNVHERESNKPRHLLLNEPACETVNQDSGVGGPG